MDRDALLNAVTDWRVARGKLDRDASPRRGGEGGGVSLPLLTPASNPLEDQNQSQKSSDRRRRETWLTPFGSAWSQRYGCPLETVPWGQLARSLKSLVDEFGSDAVIARWANYLAATEARFASPSRFASTYGAWERPAVAHGAVALEPVQGEDVDAYISRQNAAFRSQR